MRGLIPLRSAGSAGAGLRHNQTLFTNSLHIARHFCYFSRSPIMD